MSMQRQLDDAYNAGARGGTPTGGSDEEMAAFNAGLQVHRQRLGPAGPGTGGGLALLPFVFLAPVVFVIGTCMYPLPGVLTLVGVAMISGLLDDRVGSLMVLLAVLVPGVVIFMLGLRLERRLEASATYRRVRHVMRLVVIGFVAHVVVFAFRGAGRFAPGTSFLDRISLLHVLLVAAAVVAAHFVLRARADRWNDAGGFFARFRLRRSA